MGDFKLLYVSTLAHFVDFSCLRFLGLWLLSVLAMRSFVLRKRRIIECLMRSLMCVLVTGES
jgi:hypothetical protein